MTEKRVPSGAGGRRQELVDALLARRGIRVEDRRGESIPRRRGEGPWRTSPAQERLWLSERLLASGGAYTLSYGVRLQGRLDVDALGGAFREIERRHEVLRTRFVVRDGEPWQHFRQEPRRDLPMVDLTALPPARRDAVLPELATTEATRPFDLENGPLWRKMLFRLETGQEHVLLLSIHHLVSDGWSLGILAEEWTALYEAFCHGRPSPLPEPSIQYADYTEWQRSFLADEERLEKHLEVLRRRLEGAELLLDLPTDRPRPAVRSFRGSLASFQVPAALSAAATGFARRYGTTLFTFLLTVFQLLLYRYSGQSGFLVGTPVAGRVRPELEPLLGLFVNVLVLRAHVGDDPPFEELLRRTGEVVLEVQAHQDVPFERLVSELRPERSLSHSLLFQVMFLLQNEPRERASLPGLEVAALDVGGGRTALFDLTLSLTEGPEGLGGGLVYSTDLFDSTTARRMMEHYVNLLAGVLEEPERSLRRIPLLSRAERRQLADWNDSSVELPSPVPVYREILQWTQRSRDALAVEQGERRLTYGDLERETRQLARRLVGRGVGLETPVAIYLDRSPEMIVAMLAVLRAGGCYVPLDPELAAGRREGVLREAGYPAVVTRSRLAADLPSACPIVDVELEDGAAEGGDVPVESPPGSASAYLLYTSGTTGRPKGVVVDHAALSRFAETTALQFGLAPGDRVLQFLSVGFDASVQEIYPTLVAGATLVLHEGPGAVPPGLLMREIEERSIHAVDLNTAYWHEVVAWLDGGRRRLPDSLRLVYFGGEAAQPAAWQRWHRLAGRVRTFNCYGPTEATCVATRHEQSVEPEKEDGAGAVPIGRPLRNVRCHVLDPRFEPVPVGVYGHLHLAGAGVARGYRDQPATTSASFLPDPFSTTPGARMYRTGDLVRWRSDGRLEFAGRADRQVKVRGFRVEPGEVEAVLMEHPAVSEAVVEVHQAPGGGARLIGYAAAEGCGEAALDEHLERRLPAYLRPERIVVLEALPRSDSGKVDREALPIPERRGGGGRPPAEGLESRLAKLWIEVLGLDAVGADDDFFALGGDSLTALRLLAGIERRFGVELSLASLIHEPTVAGQAALLESGGVGASLSPLLPLQTGGEAVPLLLVHAAGGTVGRYLPLARRLTGPVLGLQARGLDGAEPPHGTIEAVAAAHLARIDEERPGQTLRLAGWSVGGLVGFELARRMAEIGRSVELLLLMDTVPPPLPQPRPSPELDPGLELLSAFAHDLELTPADFEITPEELPGLGEEQRFDHLLRAAVRAGRLPADAGAAALRRRLAVFQALVEAARRYSPAVGWDGPALLIQARAEAYRRDLEAEASRWKELLPRLTVERLSADHHGLLRPPAIDALAARIERGLS